MLFLFLIIFLLIYFIGKPFYELAVDYNKNGWLFGFLGIAFYYVGTLIGGFILGIIQVFTHSNFVETLPKIILTLIAVPFGLLGSWGFYKVLVILWNKQTMIKNNDTLDGNLMQ